jgi:molybdopterin-guanine dinucleotide biosynthesis protein A
MTAAPASLHPDVLVVILAGGRGSRMGAGGDAPVQKGLLPLAGRPLIAHILDRLAPQAGRVVLNVNGDPAPWQGFGLPLIADAETGFPGPLAGVAAGLAYAATCAPTPAAVVFVATDTPFLPRDLVARLVGDPVALPAIAEGPSGLEPAVFAVPPDLGADLAAHRAGGGNGSMRAWLMRHEPRVVAFGRDEAGRDPFTNVNTPADLAAAAESLLPPPRS